MQIEENDGQPRKREVLHSTPNFDCVVCVNASQYIETCLRYLLKSSVF